MNKICDFLHGNLQGIPKSQRDRTECIYIWWENLWIGRDTKVRSKNALKSEGMEGMLTQLTEKKDLQKVLDVLKTDLHNCLYIYIDMVHYGLDNPSIKLWTSRDMNSAIDLVVMKYHDSFQIYAADPARDMEDVLLLIDEYRPERISGQKEIVERLEAGLKNLYKSVYGVILCRRKEQIYAIPEEKRCAFAEAEDIPKIVDLLLTEKEFRETYSREELIAQFEERFCTGMGRSMIMWQGEQIAGHIGIFAETDDFVIVSGAVVREEYRRTDAFLVLSTEFYDRICRIEQKDAYFFSTDKRQIALFKKLFEICTSYGKLTKI